MPATDEKPILLVNYTGTDEIKKITLPEDFDIARSVKRLQQGEHFYDIVARSIADYVGDISYVGYLSFFRGNELAFSEKSPDIFPEARVLTKEKLEAILTRSRRIRRFNKWIPIRLELSGAERLCDPVYGEITEDFIKPLLNESTRFYVDIPYWSVYKPIKSDDLILPLEQFRL